MRDDIVRVSALVLIIFSGIARAADAVPEPDGLWTGDIHAPTPSSLHGGRVVHDVKALRALIRRGAIIVDTSNLPHRPDNLPADSVWLPLPHKAIPGAVWIPGAGEAEIATAVGELYRQELAKRSHGSRQVPLIIYCHEMCWLSWNAAKRAVGYGYQHVNWFPEGIEGWAAAHQPSAVIEATTPSR